MNVDIDGKDFIISTQEQMVYATISTEKNLEALKDAFKWLGLSYNIVVKRVIRKDELQAKDFERLQMLEIQFRKEK